MVRSCPTRYSHLVTRYLKMIYKDTNHWDDATEVAVVGGGGCGLTTALAAARREAEVRVLEKLSYIKGNTGRSGGMIPAAGTHLQKAAGVEETAEDFAKDVFTKNHHTSDPEKTLHLCRTSKDLIEWLVDEVGIELVFIDDFKYPGHTEFRMHAPPSRTGAALIKDLRRAAEAESNVRLEIDTPTLGLVVDNKDAVQGVVIKRGEKELRLRAQKVILASNGFAGNPEMVKDYCPDMANALYFGGEGNTGEGILWGQELGAAVAFMDAYQSHASVATPDNTLITYSLIMEGGVQVNKAGERFGNESSGYSEHALAVLKQPDAEVWNLYDERLHQLGLKFEDYREALAAGIIYKGETLETLAEQIDVSATALRKTLEHYHDAADGEVEDPFGRKDGKRLNAPFHAVKVTGALFHTQGGLQVDGEARVLHENGSVIPNLYAGGGVAAGISGHGPGGYLSGNGLLTALGYGMLAGRHAGRSILTLSKEGEAK